MLPKAMPSPETPHNPLLDTSLHSREKRSSSTHQNRHTSSPNQNTLTSHYSNPTHREQAPQLRGNTNFHPTERAQQYKKSERQRNIQQVKEFDKCPPNQTKEEEIGSPPEKEFKIMIVKMSHNLENKMELQIKRPENRIEKMQEMFNKDLEEIKEELIKNE